MLSGDPAGLVSVTAQPETGSEKEHLQLDGHVDVNGALLQTENTVKENKWHTANKAK